MKIYTQVATILVMTISFLAQANNGVINDLPYKILSCEESTHGVPVLDGAKELSLSRDQYGQVTLTMIQKDQFSGNVTLIENLPMKTLACEGFVPCESYESLAVDLLFFVNFTSQNGPFDGHIESDATGSVSFICSKE